jgi:hypothetical protein
MRVKLLEVREKGFTLEARIGYKAIIATARSLPQTAFRNARPAKVGVSIRESCFAS